MSKPDEPNLQTQQKGLSTITGQPLAHESEQTGQITPPDFSHPDKGNLFFSRYKEDGSLRLYPAGSYLSDQPAKYSEDPVHVKILVVKPNESFMVILPVRRAFLDSPNAEKELALLAWEWK